MKELTNRGARKMMDWLKFCLSIGYKKSQLDGLQEIFYKYKDEDGNLVKPPKQ